MTDPAGPLAHVKVLDLTRLFPGAFCTVLLADHGAEVVKVEAPGAGDGMRPMAAPGAFNPSHVALNRGKRSLVLDLRSPPGNRLEALKGDLKGFHSIRVNDQWRLVFRWEGNNALDVSLMDYHR